MSLGLDRGVAGRWPEGCLPCPGAAVPEPPVGLGSAAAPRPSPCEPTVPISRCCRYTVLFSHGNAVDLGQMSSFYIGLGTRINCNIFSYDYSGYGVSTGKPSERNLYSDIDAAWQALRTR